MAVQVGRVEQASGLFVVTQVENGFVEAAFGGHFKLKNMFA
jgi:hypothetical protein